MRSLATKCAHKDRFVKAHGMCGTCYQKSALYPRATACRHTNRPSCVQGMCKACYNKSDLKPRATSCPHTSRPVAAHGLCNPCYKKSTLHPKATACPHTDSAAVGYGMCSACWRRKRTFGVVLQNRPCDICGELRARQASDHDHTTGLVRGVLCENCNHGLGNFRDRPDLLAKAVDYLAAAKRRSLWGKHAS